jgi:hypothetical protein
MGCSKTVWQNVEHGADRGYDVTVHEMPCGSTGIHGQRMLCKYCEQNPPKTWGDIYGYEDIKNGL